MKKSGWIWVIAAGLALLPILAVAILAFCKVETYRWIEFWGAYMGFVGTVILGAVALYQNHKLYLENKKLEEINYINQYAIMLFPTDNNPDSFLFCDNLASNVNAAILNASENPSKCLGLHITYACNKNPDMFKVLSGKITIGEKVIFDVEGKSQYRYTQPIDNNKVQIALDIHINNEILQTLQQPNRIFILEVCLLVKSNIFCVETGFVCRHMFMKKDDMLEVQTLMIMPFDSPTKVKQLNNIFEQD